MTQLEKIRIDKWLWAARFYKTRSLAATEVGKGRIELNGQPCTKPAREVKVGDMLAIRQEQTSRTLEIKALSAVRGPAPVAQLLYEETRESIQAREAEKERRRLANEPADTILHGRPTKRDRRNLEGLKRGY